MNLPKQDLEHILARTPDVWERLRDQRIFVTGGTGFFGAWLVESFLHANSQLGLKASLHLLTRNRDALLSRMPHLQNQPALHFVEGDVTSFAFPSGEFSHLIHAATPTTQFSTPDEHSQLFKQIVRGTERVIEFAAQAGTRRLLHTSSGGVYGRQPSALTHIREDFTGAPLAWDPRSAYGEGKRASELLISCQNPAHAPEWVTARCFAFVGPRMPLDAQFAIGNFIGDALAQKPIVIRGDGTPLRSYLYAADLAIWLWNLLIRGKTASTYNVGSPHDLTIAQTAGKVAQIAAKLGLKTEVQVLKTAQPGALPERYVPATQRAQTDLGLETWISLDDAIERTLRWHQSQSDI